MSHAAHVTSFEAVKSAAPENVDAMSGSMHMILWMIVGTFAGGALGCWEVYRAPGMFLPAVTMISAVTGSVVGAAIGQLIGGLMHVIVDRSLD